MPYPKNFLQVCLKPKMYIFKFQNFTNRKKEMARDFSSILSQHEELRRATLLKHRKVSTQLKVLFYINIIKDIEKNHILLQLPLI